MAAAIRDPRQDAPRRAGGARKSATGRRAGSWVPCGREAALARPAGAAAGRSRFDPLATIRAATVARPVERRSGNGRVGQRLVTVGEAARALGKTPDAVRALVRRGTLEAR